MTDVPHPPRRSSPPCGGGRTAPSTPDAVYQAFAEWAEAGGRPLYPAQDEALIELVSGANVVLSTPTGTGKSLVAAGAHFAALAEGKRSYSHGADQGPRLREVLPSSWTCSARRTSAW